MNLETTVSQGLRIADDKAQYDAACKRLLSEKMILAWIMKACMLEFREIDVKEIAEKYIKGTPQIAEVPVLPDETGSARISGTGVEDSSVNEGTITYDIRFEAVVPVSGELICLIVNLEAQNDFYPGYPLLKRAVYYCSRMISSQYGTEFTNSHYEKIKKVYSIWICMNPPKNRWNSITGYSIAEKQLIGNVQNPVRDYDLLNVVMICLGKPEQDDNDILKLLDVLFSSDKGSDDKRKILQDDFDIPMTETIEGSVSQMCNLSKGIEDKGIAIGEARGEARGTNNVLTLMQKLFAAGRVADAEKASNDKAYCNKLLAEFGLAK